MKWFDSLIRRKKQPTIDISRPDSAATNSTTDSQKHLHRDIDQREASISLLSRETNHYRESVTHITVTGVLQSLAEKIGESFSYISFGKMCMISFLGVLSVIIYGLGFVLRTEKNIARILSMEPAEIMSHESIVLIDDLWRDYQIIGIFAENPLFPIEPLTTYGSLLSYARVIKKSLKIMIDLEPAFLTWKESPSTISILPAIQTIFSQLQTTVPVLTHARDTLTKFLGSGDYPMDAIDNALVRVEALARSRATGEKLLGKEGTSRILVLNQNSDEIRAGGGFPGTAFILEFTDGKLSKLEFYDIYALDYKLTGYRDSPPGIDQLKSIDYPGKPVEFEIRDANYYPLFYQSAQKIDELSTIAGIGSVDLVIGINQKLLEDMIELSGPIKIPGIPTPLNHSNFTTILSLLVEGKKKIQNTTNSKSTVTLIAHTLLDRIHQNHLEKKSLALIVKHLMTGEIVIGSPRPDIQQSIDSLRIIDQWQYDTGDWIYPLFTSISKNKSDRLMNRDFMIQQTTLCDRTITLLQTHGFDFTEESRIKNLAQMLGLDDKLSLLLPVQGRGENRQYMRFVLPPGTILTSTDSAWSMRESNPQFVIIDGYISTKQGSKSTLSLSYRLKSDHCSPVTTHYKQPGLRSTQVTIKKGDTIIYQKFYE